MAKSTALWQLANKRFVLIGNPQSRPVGLFQTALTRRGLAPAHVIAYTDLLSDQVILPDVLQTDDIVRIETPGRNAEVELALLKLGADTPDPEGTPYASVSRDTLENLAWRYLEEYQLGAVHYPRQWYLGYCALLRRIEQQLAACPPHHLMNTPADIALMFDKRQSHTLLEQHGIPVPRSLGRLLCYDELATSIQHSGYHQVFVKLAHGSSASGAIAYRTNGNEHVAITTVDEIRYDRNRYPILYNTRRLRTLHDLSEIAELIDAVCLHRAHIEQWLPKAGIDGYAFDLRVVLIGGQVRHVVPRLSRSPITNLHLLNQRGDSNAVRERMGTTAWDALCHTCQRAMELFPNSLYAGLDVLVLPGYRRHVLLECNAFGDLLPGILWEGMDTYETEIAALVTEYTCSARGKGLSFR